MYGLFQMLSMLLNSFIQKSFIKNPENEVDCMAREELRLFTKISFYIALAVILLLPISFFFTLSGLFVFLFLASVFGIPLSIVSMFSRENLAIRIFSLIVNFAPSTLIGYALFMEFMNEFLRSPPGILCKPHFSVGSAPSILLEKDLFFINFH